MILNLSLFCVCVWVVGVLGQRALTLVGYVFAVGKHSLLCTACPVRRAWSVCACLPPETNGLCTGCQVFLPQKRLGHFLKMAAAAGRSCVRVQIRQGT